MLNLLSILVLMGGRELGEPEPAKTVDCPPQEKLVLVNTARHEMLLCSGGIAVHQFKVAIGSGGVAPKRVGWAQTPLGRFSLRPGRPSEKYHLFVGLVNPDVKRFTAWAIGIHGPPRDTRLLGALNVSVDWTLGCIAVSSDAEIDQVNAWLKTERVTTVVFQ